MISDFRIDAERLTSELAAARSKNERLEAFLGELGLRAETIAEGCPWISNATKLLAVSVDVEGFQRRLGPEYDVVKEEILFSAHGLFKGNPTR